MGTRKKWDSCLPVPELPVGLLMCIISLLAVLCFYTSLHGDFVFDDVEAVVNNGDIKLSTPLLNMFGNDFWGTRITHNASHKSYRPLAVLSFRLNILAASGELRATHFHLVNLILYITVCCLSFFVFKCLCGAASCDRVAFVASVIFTVHPVHTEAVAPVVGRADLLCALFMFIALLIYVCALDNRSKPITNVLCTAMTIVFAAISMFTKEQGITILAICSVYDLLISNKLHPRKFLLRETWATCDTTRLVARQVVLGLSAITLLLLRWWIMGGAVPVFQKVDNPASFLDSMYLRVLNYIYIYALNVWLLLCPEWLCFDWSMGCIPLILSIHDTRVLIVVIFSASIGLLFISSLRNTGGETRRILMALAFMVLPFVPASNIFFHVGFVIAERVLFVPSLGFCLLVALGMRQLSCTRVWQLVFPICLTILVVIFCVRSHLRTTQWTTEPVLFLSALTVCPLNAKVQYNLAKTSPNHTVAMKYYENALRLNPEYDQAMNNLANILKDIGKLAEAEALLRKALQLRPDFAAAWMNLGIVLSHQKQFKEAEECYKNAIRHRRKYPDCYYNLGNLYLEQKQHSKAYESWLQATSQDPYHHAAWNNLVIMLDSLGKHSLASSIGLEALMKLPNSSAIHFNVANSLGKIKNFSEAEKHFKAAIKINSKYPLYYVNLGVLYHHWKKFELAKEMYLEALKLDPNLKSPKDNLRLLRS